MKSAPTPDTSGAVNPQINLPYTIYLAVAAAFGGLLFGFDIAIITGAGPFLIEHFRLNDSELSR